VARWPVAIWQPGAPCSGTLRPVAITLHHQAGSGNPLPVYKSRNVSAHFWIPRSSSVRVYQHVDTSVRAWHGVAHNNYGIGVETEGCGSPPHADPLTEYQLDMFAQLMAWANQAHGIPLKLSEAVDQPGLNYHRCKGGPPTGCPCDVRKNARAEILRRAGGTGTTPPPGPAWTEDDDMIIKEPDNKVYQLVYGGTGSYWRTLPANAAARVPAASIIADDGSLLSLWKVGANP
jgi:N-acetylmuramoyl-L-alanine amidase